MVCERGTAMNLISLLTRNSPAAALLEHEEWAFEAQTVFSWKFLITDPTRPRVSCVGGSHSIFTVKMLSYPKSLITVEFSMNFGDHLYLQCGIFLSEGRT